MGRGAFSLASAYFAEAARFFETDDPYLARVETWKAAEILFEQREPQAALAWARQTPVLGAAEVRGVAYLLLKNEPAAEREFAAARTILVPLIGDYMAKGSSSLIASEPPAIQTSEKVIAVADYRCLAPNTFLRRACSPN